MFQLFCGRLLTRFPLGDSPTGFSRAVVRVDVFVEIARVSGPIGTVAALERFLACVRSLMFHQIVRVAGRIWALVTFGH